MSVTGGILRIADLKTLQTNSNGLPNLIRDSLTIVGSNRQDSTGTQPPSRPVRSGLLVLRDSLPDSYGSARGRSSSAPRRGPALTGRLFKVTVTVAPGPFKFRKRPSRRPGENCDQRELVVIGHCVRFQQNYFLILERVGRFVLGYTYSL